MNDVLALRESAPLIRLVSPEMALEPRHHHARRQIA